MKSYKVAIAIIAVSLAAGFFGGYRIWGTGDRGKVDVRQLLRTLEEEVGRIEQKNKDLVATIEASKREVAASEAIRKENRDLKDRLRNALQEKTALDNSIAELRAKEVDMRNELADAKAKASEGEKLRLTIGDLNARVSTLENENRELKSVIDNISEITQRKQEAR